MMQWRERATVLDTLAVIEMCSFSKIPKVLSLVQNARKFCLIMMYSIVMRIEEKGPGLTKESKCFDARR